MSKQGIQRFAQILSEIQQTRIFLLGSVDHDDIQLGQMLEEMKELVKDEFSRITVKEMVNETTKEYWMERAEAAETDRRNEYNEAIRIAAGIAYRHVLFYHNSEPDAAAVRDAILREVKP